METTSHLDGIDTKVPNTDDTFASGFVPQTVLKDGSIAAIFRVCGLSSLLSSPLHASFCFWCNVGKLTKKRFSMSKLAAFRQLEKHLAEQL
jgi:hypothetical protein